MVEVVATGSFTEWFGALAKGDKASVDLVVGLLRSQGVALGTPYSSAVMGEGPGGKETP